MQEIKNRIDQALSEGKSAYWLINTVGTTPILDRNQLDRDRILETFSLYRLTALPCSFPLYQFEKQ
jgi:hypothetical protein